MPLLAKDLSEELKPNVEGEKWLTLKIIPGHRPEVTFTGLWTGQYIKAAIDGIAKAYRLRGRDEIRRMGKPQPTVDVETNQVKPEGGK